MNGEMLWFNEAKDHGLIATDAGERLYVHRTYFVGGRAPVGRCAGLPVCFEVAEIGGRLSACGVSLVVEHDSGRARFRRGHRFR
jgi:cold shock CspA family protein